jgi:TPR repeat protein
VDHLSSLTRLRQRRDELKPLQPLVSPDQKPDLVLLVTKSFNEWSKDADAAAAEWRAGKAAGHSSAARALAEVHASDDMCSVWVGGGEGWAVQRDRECAGGRVRDDALAVQMYALAEALGDAECEALVGGLRSCEASEHMLTLTRELRAQAALTHHEAQHVLGTVFLHGTMGFSQDLDAAFALFGRAAQANYAPAQSSLVCHVTWGCGVG